MTGHIITLRSIRIFVFILIAVSCSKGVDYQLDELEKQISSDPNSAYEELASISQHRLNSKSRRARHALLMSLAMDKSYIDVADDSLIQIAVNYYVRKGTDRELMQAMYSLSRVQINAGNSTAAIVSLLQAKQLAEKLSDYHYLGLACRNIADLYGSCRDEDTELEYFEESYQAFVRGGEENYAAYSLLGRARVHMAKGKTDVADSLLKKIEGYARNEQDNYLLATVLRDRALNTIIAKNPVAETVVLYNRLADSLHSVAKLTADYGALARAYQMMGNKDSVSYYMSMAEQSAHSLLDSAQLYNTLSILLEQQGKYKNANELIRKAVELHNRIVFKGENHQISNAISNYKEQEATRQMLIAQNRLLLIILIGIILIIVLLAVIQIIYIRKKQLQEKSRIIIEKEKKIEEDLVLLEEMAEKLQVAKEDQSQMGKAITELMKDKIAIVKRCADAYATVKNKASENHRDPYHFLDDNPTIRKTQEMENFLQALEDFRKDSTLFDDLEKSVNTWRDNIMVKIRRVCSKDIMNRPRFSEEDFRTIMLFYAGIPDRTIAFLLDVSCAAVRTRKTRYKDRLLQPDIENGSYFVQELLLF